MVTKEQVDKAEAKWARLEDKATEAEDAAEAAAKAVAEANAAAYAAAKAAAKAVAAAYAAAYAAYYDVKKADEAWDKYRKLWREYFDESN